jgi:hypothetical protein
MPDDENFLSNTTHHRPWNKGKLIGAKPPLLPKHVWSIRTRLLERDAFRFAHNLNFENSWRIRRV